MATENITPEIINRPKEVEYAIKMLLTSLVFGAVVGYLNISALADNEYFLIYSYILLLGLLLNGYITYKISQNRNWARKVYIVFTLLSTILYIPELAKMFLATPLNGFLQLVNMFIQLFAVYFLLQKGATEWFQLVNGKPVKSKTV